MKGKPKTVSSERTRPRDKSKTEQGLLLAIQRVKANGRTLSISAVAREVGVTPSLIHKVYPHIAGQIRILVGRSPRQQRDSKQAELTAAKQANRTLRADLKAALADIDRLVSINLSLERELLELRAELAGEVTPLRPRAEKPS